MFINLFVDMTPSTRPFQTLYTFECFVYNGDCIFSYPETSIPSDFYYSIEGSDLNATVIIGTMIAVMCIAVIGVTFKKYRLQRMNYHKIQESEISPIVCNGHNCYG